ncbi:SusC/RagA family TonB-linked outer membrane protein [Chitinophaga japonensis]|uniref:TonB-linked SusC/RagA family outer membrane protein n=1 Tax=Chitinophaga japonensis TaxID=104662 RepID=A0A562T5Z5_CHIJA|nr:TonB-dependent receptor [Chitinophaga japonensis]TWI88688.1 TonB-linked SusC/RagA family outer membrane protein [Chitinophaga japonensis]
MYTRKILFLLALLCGLSSFAWGQRVSGTVFDKTTHQPVIGATIAADKTHGTVTNEKGEFSLQVPEGAQSLQVSFIGYKTQTIVLTGEKSYAVQLETDGRSLDEYVAVGYGTQRKANLTGAVNTVDVSKTMVSRPLTDPSKALQGVVPGLTITYGNGGLTTAPGINIRGIGSVNGASRPLILVDNVETSDLSIINPSDIESISVLKDAASASIYGARAAFGVVLIKTKSGLRNMKTTVSYSNNFSWSTYTTLPDFADPVKELTGIYEGAQRSGISSPEIFGMQLLKLRDGIANWQQKYAGNRTSDEMVEGEDFEMQDGRMYFYRVWDVKDKMLRKWTPQQIHDLKVMGGSEKVGYYLSAGYSDQGGEMKMNPDNVKKYNIVAGVDATVTKWLDVRGRMLYRQFKYEYPYQYQSYFYYMWRWGAYFPYGTREGTYFRHVPAYLSQARTSSLTDNYQRVDLGATIKVNKHINIRADYTIGRDNNIRHEVGGPISAWDFWASGAPQVRNIATASQNEVEYGTGRYKVNTLNAYATYENTFPGKHKIKFMAGVNAEENESIGFTANRQNPLDPEKGELPLAVGAQTVDGYHGNDAYAGYFTRFNYAFRDKWLLELNGRYDGSSSFPAGDKWAFFPSGSVGYRVTEEPFMQGIRRTLSDWKLRASYGTLGNQDVGGKYFIPSMPVTSANWVTPDNVRAPAIGAPIAVAESLTWERVKMLNLGTDISLFNNRVGVTFDWFERNTTGMHTSKAVGATFGANAPRVNDGTLRTRGWEISIDGVYNINKDLAIYGVFTLADSKSVITQWDNPSMLLSQNYAGKTWGEIWGFETDRYFTEQDDMENKGEIPDQTALASGNFVYGPGDIKYKDLNGDSVINAGKLTATDHGDLKVIGNNQPRYQYGFRIGGSWKHLDLDIFFQGVGKRDFWGIGDVALPLYRGADIMYDHQLDYWTPTNTGAKYPRPYSGNASGRIAGLANGGNNFYPQSKYLLNLAYLRLKNVTLGYSLPDHLLKSMHLQKLRVYVSGQNLADIISNVGIPLDPEITDGELGFIGRTFPFQRTYSFGLQVIF